MNQTLNITNNPLYTGTNWSWTERFPSFPASVYSAILYLKTGANPAIEIPSVADGESFKFTASADENKSLPSGLYAFQYIAVLDGSKEVIVQGRITINTCLNSEGCDLRGRWEKLLEKLWAAYEKAAERGWAEIETDGDVIRYTRETLLNEIKYAEARAASERRIATGTTYPRIHKARFVR